MQIPKEDVPGWHLEHFTGNRRHRELLRAFLAASSPTECRRQTQHWLTEAQELSWCHGDG